MFFCLDAKEPKDQGRHKHSAHPCVPRLPLCDSITKGHFFYCSSLKFGCLIFAQLSIKDQGLTAEINNTKSLIRACARMCCIIMRA
jgi:hypothetical protein